MTRREIARWAGSIAAGVFTTSCAGFRGNSESLASGRECVLRLLTWLASPEKEQFDRVLDQFNKSHPGIEVRQETASGGGSAIINDILRTQMAAGAPPDLFFMVSGEIAGPFLDAGQISPLDSSYERFGWKDLLVPWTLNVVRRRGHLYGVPRSSRGLGLWYRTDIFTQLGIREPAGYEDLEALCRRLREAGIYPLSMGGKYGWNTMRLLDYFLEMCCGPELHDQLNRMETSWNRSEVTASYRLLKKWADSDWIIPGFLAVAPNDARFPWYRGEAAMLFEGNFLETEMKNDERDTKQFDFFLPPTGHVPMRFSAFPEQIMVAALSPHQREAVTFLNWYLQPEVQGKYFDDLGGATATLGVKPDAEKWPHLAKWRNVLETGSTFPPTDQVLVKEVADAWFGIQDSVVSGELDPEMAGAAVQSAIEEWKGGRKKR